MVEPLQKKPAPSLINGRKVAMVPPMIMRLKIRGLTFTNKRPWPIATEPHQEGGQTKPWPWPFVVGPIIEDVENDAWIVAGFPDAAQVDKEGRVASKYGPLDGLICIARVPIDEDEPITESFMPAPDAKIYLEELERVAVYNWNHAPEEDEGDDGATS